MSVYNGWTNYETWNVALWLDNDEGSSRYWAGQAQEAWEASTHERSFTREEVSSHMLEDWLKEQIEADAPELGASMWSDLLSAALSEVNWREIAEHYISDVDKTEEVSEEEAEVE